MKVCDRCRKQMDTNDISNLAGDKFELCIRCAEYISNHIRNYKPGKGFVDKMSGLITGK